MSFLASSGRGRSIASAKSILIGHSPSEASAANASVARDKDGFGHRIAQQKFGHHVVDDRRGRMRSIAAMLDDAGNRVARCFDRREGDEQRMRLGFPAGRVPLATSWPNVCEVPVLPAISMPGIVSASAIGRAPLLVHHRDSCRRGRVADARDRCPRAAAAGVARGGLEQRSGARPRCPLRCARSSRASCSGWPTHSPGQSPQLMVSPGYQGSSSVARFQAVSGMTPAFRPANSQG